MALFGIVLLVPGACALGISRLPLVGVYPTPRADH
jgi:hypothetical protein